MRYIQGQAALTAIVFFLLISLVMLATFAGLGVTQLNASNELLWSTATYINTDSGLEDANYRVTNGLNYQTAGLPKIIFSNLNGATVTTNISINPDGDSATNDFTLDAQSNLSNRFRHAKMAFTIPDKNLFVGASDAIQAGFLGVTLNSNSSISSSQGPGKAGVVSNGTVRANLGSPYVDGNVVVSRGAGALPWHKYCTRSSIAPLNADCSSVGDSNVIADANADAFIDNCPASPCEFDLSRKTGPGPFEGGDGIYAGAQSFIAANTSDVIKMKVFLARIGTPPDNVQTQIFNNRRITIYNSSGVWKTDGVACTTLSSTCIDFPDYGSALSTGNLQTNNGNTNGRFGWATADLTAAQSIIAGEKYWLVFNPAPSSQGYYKIGTVDDGYTMTYADGNEYIYTNSTFDELRYYRYTNSNLINPNIDNPTDATKKKDIAFQIFIGETPTSIDGYQAGGSLNVVGNGIAETMRGVDIDGTAYYDNNSPWANAPSNYSNSGDVTAAGGSPGTAKNFDCPAAVSVPGQVQCTESNNPAYLCRTPSTSANARVNPYTNYCGCAQYDHNATSYCQNASGSNSIPNWQFVFGQGGPLNVDELNKKRARAQSLGCRVVSIGGTLSVDNACTGVSTYTYSPAPVASPHTPTTIDYGVIEGNVTFDVLDKVLISGLNTSSKCPYWGTDGDASTSDTSPCYDFWIKGNLLIKDTASTTGSGADSLPCSSQPLNSIFIIVEGTVTFQDKAQAYGFKPCDALGNPTKRGGMFIVSNDPTYSGGTTAITLNNSASGSVFWATRGAVTINGTVSAKSIGAPKIILNAQSSIVYDTGLADPYSDGGGVQPKGSSINEYHEIE